MQEASRTTHAGEGLTGSLLTTIPGCSGVFADVTLHSTRSASQLACSGMCAVAILRRPLQATHAGINRGCDVPGAHAWSCPGKPPAICRCVWRAVCTLRR